MKTSNIIIIVAFIIGVILMVIDLRRVNFENPLSKKIHNESIFLESFEDVVVDGKAQVRIVSGNRQKLTYLSKDPGNKDFNIKNGVLYIGGQRGDVLSLETNLLRQLNAKGESEVSIQGFQQDFLEIQAVDAAHIAIINCELINMVVVAKDQSYVDEDYQFTDIFTSREKKLPSHVQHLEISLKGNAKLRLRSFRCDTLSGKVIGHGFVSLGATKQMQLETTGKWLTLK